MELAFLDQIKRVLHPTPLQSTPDLAFSKISLLKLTFWNHSRFGELILNCFQLPWKTFQNFPVFCAWSPERSYLSFIYCFIHCFISTIGLRFNMDLFWDLARNWTPQEIISASFSQWKKLPRSTETFSPFWVLRGNYFIFPYKFIHILLLTDSFQKQEHKKR